MLRNKIKIPSGREETASRLPHRTHYVATYLALNRFTSAVVSLSLEVDRFFFFYLSLCKETVTLINTNWIRNLLTSTSRNQRGT